MTASTSSTPLTAATSTTDTGTGVLLAALAAQQQRVLGIVGGLDEMQLRQAVLPSGWSCAGMLQHLGLTTMFWCLNVINGSPCDVTDVDADFVLPDGSATAVVADAAAAMARGRALAAPLPLTNPVGWWPEGHWGGWRLTTVHQVLLHLLAETACHAGHLDAARELLDGSTWDHASGGPVIRR
jgi:hypothetical protein